MPNRSPRPEERKIAVTRRVRLRFNSQARTPIYDGASIMKKMEERIAAAEEQLRRLKARHNEAEAKRKRESVRQAKKDEARRKLLVGAAVLERVDRGDIADAQFRAWMDAALVQPEDRALFNLQEPRTDSQKVSTVRLAGTGDL
jgi:hypothetical protein